MKKILIALALFIIVICAVSCSHTHTWENEEIIKAATTEEEGLAKYTCSCGETMEKAIDKIPHIHIYSHEYKTNENEHWLGCVATNCDSRDSYAEHIWSVTTVKEATRGEAGKKAKYCPVCSYSTEQEYFLGERVDKAEWQSALEYRYKNQTIYYNETEGETQTKVKVEYANGWLQYTYDNGQTEQDINKEDRFLSTDYICGILSSYSTALDDFTYDEEKREYTNNSENLNVTIQITDGRVTYILLKGSHKTQEFIFELVEKTNFEIKG